MGVASSFPRKCALRGSPFPVWIKRGRRVNRRKAVSSAMSFYGKDTTVLATVQVLYEPKMKVGVNDLHLHSICLANRAAQVSSPNRDPSLKFQSQARTLRGCAKTLDSPFTSTISPVF